MPNGQMICLPGIACSRYIRWPQKYELFIDFVQDFIPQTLNTTMEFILKAPQSTGSMFIKNNIFATEKSETNNSSTH